MALSFFVNENIFGVYQLHSISSNGPPKHNFRCHSMPVLPCYQMILISSIHLDQYILPIITAITIVSIFVFNCCAGQVMFIRAYLKCFCPQSWEKSDWSLPAQNKPCWLDSLHVNCTIWFTKAGQLNTNCQCWIWSSFKTLTVTYYMNPLVHAAMIWAN